jgi:hypothetical protein
MDHVPVGGHMALDERLRYILEEEEPPITKIRITSEAFKKMKLYAGLISEMAGREVECFGLLLNHQDKYDDIARDVFLGPEQQVTASSVNFDDFNTVYRIQKEDNKKICGMWHNHADFESFHSHKDDGHITNLYINNRWNTIPILRVKYSPQMTYNNGILTIKVDNKIITIKTEEKLEVEAEEVIERKFINSIVINKHLYSGGDPELWKSYYGEALIETKKGREKIKNLELELVEEENGIMKDLKTMIKECGEKIRYQGRKLKEYVNYDNLLKKHSGLETKTETKPEEQKNNLEAKVGEENLSQDKQAETKKEQYGYKGRLRNFYKSYEPYDEIDRAMVSVAKMLAGDYHIRRKTTEKLKELKRTYTKRAKYAASEAALYAGIEALAMSVAVLDRIEKASLNYLNKTRPDISELIKKGAPFSEIAKQYNKKTKK